MRLVLDDSANVAEWVASRIPQMSGGADFGFGAVGIGVVSSDGRPLGGVVFHNYQGRFSNIEVSFASASPRWLTRSLISGILAYPFDQLGVNRITSLTPRKTTSARRFLELFGFKREGIVRSGFGDDDMVISGLMRSEWARSRFNTRRDPAAKSERPQTSFPRKAVAKPSI